MTFAATAVPSTSRPRVRTTQKSALLSAIERDPLVSAGDLRLLRAWFNGDLTWKSPAR